MLSILSTVLSNKDIDKQMLTEKRQFQENNKNPRWSSFDSVREGAECAPELLFI